MKTTFHLVHSWTIVYFLTKNSRTKRKRLRSKWPAFVSTIWICTQSIWICIANLCLYWPLGAILIQLRFQFILPKSWQLVVLCTCRIFRKDSKSWWICSCGYYGPYIYDFVIEPVSLSIYQQMHVCGPFLLKHGWYVSLGLCILRMARYVGVCMRLYMCVYSTYPYFGWTDVVSQATSDGGVVYLF